MFRQVNCYAVDTAYNQVFFFKAYYELSFVRNNEKYLGNENWDGKQ